MSSDLHLGRLRHASTALPPTGPPATGVATGASTVRSSSTAGSRSPPSDLRLVLGATTFREFTEMLDPDDLDPVNERLRERSRRP